MKFRIFVILTCFFSIAAQGEPLRFKNWKEQQILEAQNEVLRISAKLHQQKGAKPERTEDKSADDLLRSSRFERAPDVTDKDLKSAKEGLEIARELGIEDYADVYVANLKEQDPDQFSKLMDSLSKEELSQLMKILVKNKNEDSSDAKRNKALVPPTAATTASHS